MQQRAPVDGLGCSSPNSGAAGGGFRQAVLVLSRRIALYFDVGAFPLWFMDEEGREIANTGSNGLPISQDLRAALSVWARRLYENLDEDYDEADPEVGRALAEEARGLAAALRTELGADYIVTCYADR